MSIIHRVRAISTGWSGGPGLNTFYFKEGAGTVADAAVAQLGADRVRAVCAAMAPIFPNAHTFRIDPVVDAIEDTTGTLVTSFGVTPPATVVGTGGGSYGPLPAMFLMSLRTAGVVAGRRVFGRAFVGPVVVGNDADGSPLAASLSYVAAGGAALLAAGPTGPAAVIWSRPFSGTAAPLPVRPARAGSSYSITDVVVNDKHSVLRSRRD